MNTEITEPSNGALTGYSPEQIEAINAELLRPIEDIERELLQHPQMEAPLTHIFATGLYWRQIFMPAGSFCIGHQHKTEHLNVVLQGKARVMMDGVIHDIIAPCVLRSSRNVRKVLYIIEDMIWAVPHVTDETDITKLEENLIVKSAAFIEAQKLLGNSLTPSPIKIEDVTELR